MSKLPPIVSRIKGITNIPKLLENPIPVFMNYRKKYGDTFAFFMGGSQYNLVSFDPNFCQHILQKNHRKYEKSEIQTDILARYLGHGLLTAKGDYWLRQRRLIQPGFHRKKLAALGDNMNQVIEQYYPILDKAAEEGKTVDIYQEMMDVAFRLVARSLFATSMKEEEIAILEHDITAVQEFFTKQVRLPFLSFWYRLSGQFAKVNNRSARSGQIIANVIKERRKSTVKHDDLLDMLLDARYEDTGEGMNDEQLLHETLVLFAAGHETSANALAWTLYLLHENPDASKKLLQELDEVVGDRHPNFEDLRQLKYSEQIINESMRIYPPAWITDRIALEDDEVMGFQIPKGTLMTPFIYGVHHNPTYWQDPEVFRPERFSKEQQKEQHNFAFIPFGGGPRLCIGNNFAMMSMHLVLAHLLRRYTFELLPNQQIVERPLITLRPKNGIKMKVTRK